MGKNDRVLSKGGGRRAAAASALPAPGLGLAPEPAVRGHRRDNQQGSVEGIKKKGF